MSTRKCFTCGKEHKRKGRLFCKECESKPRPKTTSTLIIYNTI